MRYYVIEQAWWIDLLDSLYVFLILSQTPAEYGMSSEFHVS